MHDYRLSKQYGTTGAGYSFPGSVPLNVMNAGQPARGILCTKAGNLVVQNDQEPHTDNTLTTPVYQTFEITTAMAAACIIIPGRFRAINNTGTTANSFIVFWG